MKGKSILMGILLCILLSLLFAGGACAYELRAEDAGFALAAETEGKALLFNEKTLQFRWIDKATGKTWDTCVLDGQQGNKTIKNLQKSLLTATYIVNAQNATTGTMDSYSKSLQTETFTWEPVENGVEIRFTLGDDTLIVDDLPKGIRADKYQKLLEGAGWTDKNRKTFQDNYRAVKVSGQDQEYMIRVKDGTLSPLLIQQLHALIFDSGIYTEEDLEEDNAAVNYEREYLPELYVTLRCALEGEDLVFTVPCSQVASTPDNEIISLDLLPYFLAADTAQDGFMLVPDGSGALIYLNNAKAAVTAYSMPVYGRDALINANVYTSPRQDVALPVFGLKRTDSAVVAIIEKGAELANIYANISGRSDEFNRTNASFILRDVESVSLAGNESITSPRYSSDVYQGDIVMRFQWLTNEADGCLEMAQAYRRYLLGRGILAEAEKDENAPFYLEVLGAAKKDKFFLGIPYASTVQATTIAQAGDIYAAVREAGIGNIRMIFSGLFSGGIKNASLTGARLDGGMGDMRALLALSQRLKENGDTLYPALYWGRVYSRNDFNILSQASRKHDGEPAQAYTFAQPILKHAHTNHPGYFVSPHYLPEYTRKALSALEKYQLDGLALFDLGNTPVGDFKRRQNMSRITAVPVYEEALEAIGKDYSLLLNRPLLYALPYADGATNLPDGDNGFAIADVSIPFLQWVLCGSMPYSASSWNLKGYMGMEPQLLWALESQSAPRFTFTWQDPSVFDNTEDHDYMASFSSQYRDYLDTAAEMYRVYNDFYRQVRGAQVSAYQIITPSLRKVTYDNGVELYVNYGKTQALADGETIPAQGYLIREGGAQ